MDKYEVLRSANEDELQRKMNSFAKCGYVLKQFSTQYTPNGIVMIVIMELVE